MFGVVSVTVAVVVVLVIVIVIVLVLVIAQINKHPNRDPKLWGLSFE